MRLAEKQHQAILVLTSMSPQVAQEARQMLLDLAFTATGTIPAYSPSGRGAMGSREPSCGDPFPPQYELIHRIAMAGSETAVRSAVEWARSELRAIRLRPVVDVKGETEKDRSRRIIEQGEGWTAVEVAAALRVPVSEVRRARMTADRDPHSGLIRAVRRELSASERRQRARQLSRAGHPVSSIASQLGVHEVTVRRDLGRRAA